MQTGARTHNQQPDTRALVLGAPTCRQLDERGELDVFPVVSRL